MTARIVLSAIAYVLAWPSVAAASGYEGYLISFLVSTAISVAISALTAPNVKGPRQQDQAMQGSDYGRPINRMWGTVRVNGTVRWEGPLVESKRKRSASGGSSTTFSYTKSCAILIGQKVAGAELLQIRANKKIIYDEGATTFATAVRFYDGTQTEPDPTIQAIEGADDVQAFVESMYVVIDTLEMAGLGPPLPQFEFTIRAHAEISVAQVVTEIVELAGMSIDVSLLEGNAGLLDGYVVGSEVSAGDALVPLCAAYYFDIAERHGELVAVPRGMDPVATIPLEDLGAVEAGSVPVLPEWTRMEEAKMPREVAVTSQALFRDLQPDTQRAIRNLGNASENVALDLPVVLDSGQRKRIAHRLLWDIVAGRRKVKTTWSDRWLDVQPGDVVRFPTPALTMLPLRLERDRRGANGVHEVELGYFDKAAYDCNVIDPAEAPVDGGGTRDPAAATLMVLLDIPILRDSHDGPIFYWAGAGEGTPWSGFRAQRSTDSGTNWEAMGDTTGPSVIGNVATAVADGPTTIWDEANSIDVVLLGDSDELESLSEDAVLNGGNVAWIGPASGYGGEIVQFQEAELIAANTYRLTRLLRGRRGTEWTVAEHGADEIFVLLSDSANLKRQDFGAADLDLARLYKPVSVGASIDDTDAQAFTNTGESVRPLSPAHLVGRRRAGGSIDISWMRRSRLMSGPIGTPLPLGEDGEEYQLLIYSDEARTELLREVKKENIADYRYTAAEQTADGLTPGDPVWITVAQHSAVRGFGRIAVSSVG